MYLNVVSTAPLYHFLAANETVHPLTSGQGGTSRIHSGKILAVLCSIPKYPLMRSQDRRETTLYILPFHPGHIV